MGKNLAAFISILFITLNSFGQKEIDYSIDSLKNINTDLVKEILKSTETIKLLEQRINQANDTINNQNSITSSFGTLYTIITIIFALIGIIIPILTYLFSLKPTQDIVKNFDSKIDERLKDYLLSNRERKVSESIKNLLSDNDQERNNAISFLQLTVYEGFTDTQLFNIYKSLKSEKFDKTFREQISLILSLNENDYATEYFSTILKTNDRQNEWLAARYFGLIGVQKYLNLINNYIKQSEDKAATFLNIIFFMKLTSMSSIIDFLNSDETISIFEGEDWEKVKQSLKQYFERQTELPRVKETKMMKKIEEM